jgi:hypothetical protein
MTRDENSSRDVGPTPSHSPSLIGRSAPLCASCSPALCPTGQQAAHNPHPIRLTASQISAIANFFNRTPSPPTDRPTADDFDI